MAYEASPQSSDDDVLTPLFAFDDVSVVMREKRAHAEHRRALLRRCALLARIWLEGYERKMPPLERRSYRDRDAQAKHACAVMSSISKLVTRLTMLASMQEWHDAVDDVRALDFDDAVAELLAS